MMQANVKKAIGLEEIYDRDEGPSDIFKFVVSAYLISDDNLDDFIINFFKMAVLN